LNRRCLIVHADGADVETFERLLAAGALPAIAEHVVARGGYRRATSVAPSTTGPAHVPLLCGRYPGTADVPGYRWFDRRTHRPGLPLGPWCLRSYTTEGLRFAADLAPGTTTIFERARRPMSAFGVLEQGVPDAGRLFARRRPAVLLHSHYFHDYERVDGLTARALTAAVRGGADLAFLNFPGPDWNAHYKGFGTPAVERAFALVDRAVAAAADELRRRGDYERTLLLVCSDHGHAAVERHRDLPRMLDRQVGIRTAYASLMAFRPRPEMIACVSGNGMAHLHLKVGPDWSRRPGTADRVAERFPALRPALLAEESVDIVAIRDGDGAVVESRRGSAWLGEETPGGALRYEVRTGDPFGFDPLPERLDPEAALKATFATEYPDALMQVAQLLRSPRSGDVVVSATPGYDLRERFEWPEHLSGHGALHRKHMLVPVASSVPLDDGPLRTADVAPTVLDWLGAPPLEGIDGRSRLS
jgi:hypothetical protein